MHAGYSGINLLAKDRVSHFRQTTKFYGLKERRGELVLPVEGHEFGAHPLFSFSQACLDIVQLTKLPPERKESEMVNFKSLLRTDDFRDDPQRTR